MATLVIRLEIDPTTRKKNVIIKYDSDSDALPSEHEEAHKKLVDALIANGTLTAEDLGHITIEREAPSSGADATPAAAAPAAQQKAGHKG